MMWTGSKPRKAKGWCEENAVEHAWADMARTAVDAPYCRTCENCGRSECLECLDGPKPRPYTQKLTPVRWVEVRAARE